MVVSLYVVIVYDVGIERVDKVRKFLKKYLNWVQNSVLEGELTKAELLKVKRGIKDIVDEDLDSILIFSTKSEYFLKKEIIGVEKGLTWKII